MIPLSHLSFAQGGQVKCLPKKKVIIKVSHSVVAEGIGWLVDFGLNGPLRQYFSLYQAVPQREGERGKKR